MNRPAIALLGLVVVLATVGLHARYACAHTPPPIYASIDVTAEDVTWEMLIGGAVFEDWFSLKAADFKEPDPARLEAAQPHVELFFADWARVLVDGLPVKGILVDLRTTEFTDHGVPWEFVRVRVVYGTKGRPRQVALAWKNFDGGIGAWFDRVEAEVEGFGETQYFVFREKEPEIVWHAPLGERRPLPPPRPEPVQRIRVLLVPVLTITIALLMLLAVPLLHRWRVAFAGRWAVLGVLFALGLSFANVARTEVAWPLEDRFERPDEARALYLFESLHRNVYRAFDYDSEDDIYETLAVSVTGDLLDDVYAEVYSSLVLQEEGGAVCKIQKVELLEADVEFPEDEAARYFRVRAHWRVHGKVGHWGHTHQRVNEYVANYRVELVDDTWKISEVQVVSQERVDDGTKRGG